MSDASKKTASLTVSNTDFVDVGSNIAIGSLTFLQKIQRFFGLRHSNYYRVVGKTSSTLEIVRRS